MNASLLLLSTAWLAADPGPIVVSGAGCTNCGSAAAVASQSYSSPSFASASFGAAACGGSCGSARASLFDRLRARFSRPHSAGCGTADCGPPVAAAACGTPACGSPLRSSFVASHTATAAPACGPALRSSFVTVGSSGCCDSAPARVGLFSRLRARTSGSGACGGCGTPTATVVAAPACGGCTGSVGTVGSGTYYGGTVVGSSPVAPPVVMPAPIVTPGPVVMPPPPVDKPKDKEPKKEPVKDKTSLEPAPIVPLVPSDLPRIPTLNGTSGD